MNTPTPTRHHDVVDDLEPEECWRLLERVSVARLAVVDELGADIFPINFLVHNGLVYFRSAPGTKIVRATEHPGVAVEFDGTYDGLRWSVVIRGDIRRLSDDAEIHASGVDKLHTFTAATKWNYFVISPRTISGVRFRTSRRLSDGGRS
ncbi:Nitroimidazol reductase NimA, pyridoxamine 5'-phosphate oxidase superfamily [Agreia bicolorata]|uniref:Nitroimidazol reductase NimA, pyridoxamine 5'-phosphate oxidase superfamily n=1 Tax=Agreia bicolorata TaxID=110935 RepID=A0A1T4YD08_9MICO|nr:pyridoxamine 5'-phosphate oxidase family protein [Agreia bicolorata]SKA99669.1 Nitroimidazol reductase NimA, pyridoxamine 5'-phosphate oxidase superfamily [Agreia bicolorata]